MHRFFASDAAMAGQRVTLPDGEAEHLARVLRLGPGAAVVAFDGRGRQFQATVERVKPDVRLHLGDALAAAPEAGVPLTLVQAVLKGDGMDAVVRDAVMLGAAAIQPVVTTRAETGLGVLQRGRRVERWRRIALASVKQCGRAVVPAVHDPLALGDALTTISADLRLALVEPAADAGTLVTCAELRRRPVPASVALLVGPEGGWAPEELAAIHHQGWIGLRLGGRTLRAESAAIVAISALWGGWEF
ncbi:MAG: 16S rRNA (uracil(1498)-N(3))-methyltransferase [Acidobacteriota bacterium]|nr:16S rRNA (uracil(1498)-N(3))-methyltransferase [Acidobacteriota bacterium]